MGVNEHAIKYFAGLWNLWNVLLRLWLT